MATKPKCYMQYRPYAHPGDKRVELSYAQYKAFTSLIQGHGLPQPRWLQETFNLTSNRARYMMALIDDVGLGDNWCRIGVYRDDWCDLVHALYHEAKNYEATSTAK